ncbi:MAG: TetR/AcrR family transcriptional regulator C-terminal domain-containing protein [Eubacteriales bacterium]|nr:TetR/AcrR family transcriptional regulator C-terminal domain-containing protein [Eubacteriales bacterium]
MKHSESNYLTKSAMAAGLKQLMAEKPFHKISISELAATCQINRKTFYYHFASLKDLLIWMLDQETVDIIRRYHLSDDYYSATLHVIHYMRANVDMLNAAFESIGRDELKRHLFRDLKKLLHKLVYQKEAQLDIEITSSYREFLCDFLSEGLAGVIINALNEENIPDDDEEIIENLIALKNSVADSLIHAPQLRHIRRYSSHFNK